MGTVHAKFEDDRAEVGGGDLFHEEPHVSKPAIMLNGVRARVDRVHIDGLSRTKDDIVKDTVNDLFSANTFEDVIVKAHKVRRALDTMGCFRDIGVFIDVSSGPRASPEGLEVTFHVKELSRLVGGVNTTVGENEGNLVFGVKMPNVAGRGERVHAEYSLGHRSSSNFSVTATKPLPHRRYVPVLAASVFQQTHEFPWSGYRVLDRGLLLDAAFRTSSATKHSLQWEGAVRDTSVLSKTTSFKVRESSGPQLKSVIRHIVSVDRRDDGVFPTRGASAEFRSELAGLGGGVAYLLAELRGETNVPLTDSTTLQLSAQGGVLHDVFGCTLADRLYLGGATSLRGFAQRGVGPHSDAQATGGAAYWSAALHAYAPLPFAARGPVAELFRTHVFVNAGCLSDQESLSALGVGALGAYRLGAGAGLALRLGAAARAELNYCVPLRARAGDRPAPGLQFGVGARLL